jgi:hypothetical protein
MARLVVDLRGRRFGRLVIAQDARSSTRKRKAYWPCVCDCGRKKRVRGAHLLSGAVVSCGCWRADGHVRKAAGRRNKCRRRSRPQQVGRRLHGNRSNKHRHRLQAQVVHTAAILSRRSTATFGSAGYVVQRGRTEFRLWMRSPRGGRAVDRGAPICLRGAGAHARPRWWWCRNAWDAPLIAVR